jgi:hypothetical protein
MSVAAVAAEEEENQYTHGRNLCIYILMVVFGLTYRDMQNIVPSLNLPWNNDEPYPDHT